ncbi:hypothetical protein GLW20_01510 [Virgibacillus halodenitrificans]|nr:hypothetical protein [Virgibacillus halodenitrificans]
MINNINDANLDIISYGEQFGIIVEILIGYLIVYFEVTILIIFLIVARETLFFATNNFFYNGKLQRKLLQKERYKVLIYFYKFKILSFKFLSRVKFYSTIVSNSRPDNYFYNIIMKRSVLTKFILAILSIFRPAIMNFIVLLATLYLYFKPIIINLFDELRDIFSNLEDLDFILLLQIFPGLFLIGFIIFSWYFTSRKYKVLKAKSELERELYKEIVNFHINTYKKLHNIVYYSSKNIYRLLNKKNRENFIKDLLRDIYRVELEKKEAGKLKVTNKKPLYHAIDVYNPLYSSEIKENVKYIVECLSDFKRLHPTVRNPFNYFGAAIDEWDPIWKDVDIFIDRLIGETYKRKFLKEDVLNIKRSSFKDLDKEMKNHIINQEYEFLTSQLEYDILSYFELIVDLSYLLSKIQKRFMGKKRTEDILSYLNDKK